MQLLVYLVHHSNVTKVVINFSSPSSPDIQYLKINVHKFIHVKHYLKNHDIIGCRIAEEVFYGVSVTTGAINDFRSF